MLFESHLNHCQTMDQLPLEIVERKGLGYPDTICDLLADRISFDLGQYYLETFGRLLHYNVDKALLVGGRSSPKFGGGKIVEKAKFYLGDRAISNFKDHKLDLNSIIENSIQSWLNENLRFLRLNENLEWKSEIRESSTSLNSVEDREVSNDTSVGVGYWPLSTLERLVLKIEDRLNSNFYKSPHPELGEDIKVMAVRRGRHIEIILACAMVDQIISNSKDYFDKKEVVLKKLKSDLFENFGSQFDFTLILNALDDVDAQGTDGLYLTVTGLSCESGDSGQVGRGNRVSGLISFMRPQTMEAWAGKNFKTHVGKIYSFAAQSLARIAIEQIEEVSEATVTLVGKIGSPVKEPPYVFIDYKITSGNESALKEKVQATLKKVIHSQDIFQPSALFFETKRKALMGLEVQF